jgi:hypothetical protein
MKKDIVQAFTVWKAKYVELDEIKNSYSIEDAILTMVSLSDNCRRFIQFIVCSSLSIPRKKRDIIMMVKRTICVPFKEAERIVNEIKSLEK